jgi:murein DD-endopeptidase
MERDTRLSGRRADGQRGFALAFSGAFLCMALFLLLQGCARHANLHPPQAPRLAPHHPGLAVVGTARELVGLPYRRAGHSPEIGFDCSGLVWWVYQHHGVSLPRMAREQARVGKGVRGGILPGDLLFFREGRRGNVHVGIATGQGTFIHSPKPGARVREENLSHPHWSRSFLTARRVL